MCILLSFIYQIPGISYSFPYWYIVPNWYIVNLFFSNYVWFHKIIVSYWNIQKHLQAIFFSLVGNIPKYMFLRLFNLLWNQIKPNWAMQKIQNSVTISTKHWQEKAFLRYQSIFRWELEDIPWHQYYRMIVYDKHIFCEKTYHVCCISWLLTSGWHITKCL